MNIPPKKEVDENYIAPKVLELMEKAKSNKGRNEK
jgi:hypothetical protein